MKKPLQIDTDFDDAGLAAIASAFVSRSKAISYHAKGWSLSRDMEDSERLNFDADGFHGKLRISIWPDRVIWFRLCRGTTKSGWDFLLTFSGDATEVTSDELIETAIASMTTDTSQLIEIWRDVSPAIERSEPGV